MRRYLPSRRSRKNILDTSQLRDEFIRQLSKEAEALVLQFSTQFSQTLQTQVAQAYQGIVAGDAPSIGTGQANEAGTIGSVGQLLSTGVRYLISRPRTSRNTRETLRSIDNNTQFRVSNAQAAAEAQLALSKGDKNL
jgi:hypothetical protein